MREFGKVRKLLLGGRRNRVNGHRGGTGRKTEWTTDKDGILASVNMWVVLSKPRASLNNRGMRLFHHKE